MHSTHAHPYTQWLALLFTTLATPTFAAPPAPPYVASSTELHAKACDSQAFTLEVPLWAPPLSAGFESRFAAALLLDRDWFTCTTCTGFRATLTPVLPDYSTTGVVPTARRDGHRRGFVVRFQEKENGVWRSAELTADCDCDAVAALRAAAAKAHYVPQPTAASPQPPILVSRSCGAVGQDAEAWASPSTTGWANTRIDARPSQNLAPIDVALVDTGVPKLLRSALGVVSETDLPTFEGESLDYHPHGTHMAALLRSVAPHARIRSYRALDANGMGSLSALARATDDALFDNGWLGGNRLPLVVNLSVGAPPEYFRPSKLKRGKKCSTWEDGSGEMLRYVLYVASQLEGQWQTTFIAAAGGNAPLEYTEPQLSNSYSYPPAMTPCGFTTMAEKSSFFPAAFGEHPSCRTVGTTSWLTVLPVGATTFDDARSVVTKRAVEPLVFAPGERVYAVNSQLEPTPMHVACDTADVGIARGFELPTAITGTSASTAFVSAAAAQLISRGAGPIASRMWRSREYSRLLFLTGQPICEEGVRTGGRRLSIARAELAMSSSCAALHTCLRTYLVEPAVTDTTGSRCAAAMTACFGAAASPACTPPAAEPRWPDVLLSSLDAAPVGCASAWSAAPGPLTVRPDARYVDLMLGGMGPQPATTSCATCSLVLGAGKRPMELRYEINDTMPAGTIVSDAMVVFLDRAKRPVDWVPVSSGSIWRPGDVGAVPIGDYAELPTPAYLERLSNLREQVALRRLTPVLNVAIQYGGRQARNESPLRVDPD